jgi:protein phosphatase
MTDSFQFGGRSIQVYVAGRTDVGLRRNENQDSFLVIDLTNADNGGLTLEPDVATGAAVTGAFALGDKGAVCVVADGMGGAAAGGLASNMAIACIEDELRRHWLSDRNNSPQRFAQRLREAVEAGNRKIHETSQSDERFRGMGTTLTAVGILDGFLYVAQVGDSRAYLLRLGAANQITRDQSFIQHLVDAGTITEEEAERSNHRNVILQALGTAPRVDVDLTYQELRRNDLVVVCSDGLTKVVSREELADTARQFQDPATLCDELVALVNRRGGPDNITVIAARLDGAGLEEPADGDSIGRHAYLPAGD